VVVEHSGVGPLPCLDVRLLHPWPLQDQGPALDELRKTVLRLHPDLKDKSAFWKRRTSVLKVWGEGGGCWWTNRVACRTGNVPI
jgi:hypothetical protein